MDIKKIIESIIPFMVAGVIIALCVGLLWLFFSIAIWGLLIGGILWIGTVTVQYLFPGESSTREEGRVIEHDDKK